MDGIDFEQAAEQLMRLFAPAHNNMSDGVRRHMKGEVFALRFLACHDGMALPGEIKGEMGVSSARVAAILNQLEQKNYIARALDDSDRRKVRVTLTQTGREAVKRKHREVLRLMAGHLQKLGARDTEELLRIAGRLQEIHQENTFRCTGEDII